MPAMTSTRSSGLSGGAACILLTLLGWSSAPLFLKYLSGLIDAWTANGWRYGVSALLWCPFLLAAARQGALPRGLWRAALVPTAFNIIGQMLYGLAPYFIEPGFFSFLLRTQIVFVALGAYVLFPGERAVLRSGAFWGGVAIIILGSIGTVAFGPGIPRGATAKGIIFSVTSGAFFAGYGVAVRKYMHGVRPMISFAAISQLTTLGLATLMLIVGHRHGLGAWSLTWPQFGVLVLSAWIGIGFAHVFYYAAIARLGVAISGGVILLMPFITAVASFFIFHERMNTKQWVCGSAAVIGALLILSAQSRLAASDSRPAGGAEPESDRDSSPVERPPAALVKR